MGTPTQILGTDNETGALTPLKTVNGKIRTSSMPYLYDIAEDNVDEHYPWILNCFCATVAAVETTISPLGQTAPTVSWLSSAATFTVVSSSSQDYKAGAVEYGGARTIQIHGLDSTYATCSETVTLTGATGVSTTTSFLRINRVDVITAGADGRNLGNIDLSSGGAYITQIVADANLTNSGIYTVPLGHSLYITGGFYTASNNKTSAARLYVRDYGSLFRRRVGAVLLDSTVELNNLTPMRITAKSDLEVRGTASGGSGIANAVLWGWLEAD